MTPSKKNDEDNGRQISVFDFTDYREYLKAYYAYMKQTRHHFSYRYFSRMAGLGGKSYFQMVMAGKRNLSPSSVSKFLRALRLSKKETAYFESMVLYNQAETSEGKDRYFNDMMKLRPTTAIEGLSKEQLEYLTHSLYVTIREMAAMKEFQSDPEWICMNVRSGAKSTEVKKALDVLEKLKLLERDENDHLIHSGKTLETPEHAEALEILNYHREVLNQTKEALINIPYEERDVSSMTIPIPQTLIGPVKELLRKCREDIANLVNQSAHDFYEVFQVNTQFFPVTQINKVKKEDEKL